MSDVAELKAQFRNAVATSITSGSPSASAAEATYTTILANVADLTTNLSVFESRMETSLNNVSTGVQQARQIAMASQTGIGGIATELQRQNARIARLETLMAALERRIVTNEIAPSAARAPVVAAAVAAPVMAQVAVQPKAHVQIDAAALIANMQF
jgi:hypothetical protein